MGVRHQLRNFLEKIREEEPDTDVEVYPGVNETILPFRGISGRPQDYPPNVATKPNWQRDV